MQCPFHNVSKYDVLPSVSLMLLIPSTLVFETHLFVFYNIIYARICDF